MMNLKSLSVKDGFAFVNDFEMVVESMRRTLLRILMLGTAPTLRSLSSVIYTHIIHHEVCSY